VYDTFYLFYALVNTNLNRDRYSLNYKGIPYRTKWVAYPDIEATCKRIGATYTEKNEDGTPLYTLPVIYDPSTGACVADSILIAEYLDATYPDTPTLFPPGSMTVQQAFLAAYRLALPALWQFACARTISILDARSAAHYKLVKFGKSAEDVTLTDEVRKKQWEKLKDDFGLLAGWLKKGEADGPYILGNGNTISFLDFVVAGYIIWLRVIWGEDSEEWRGIQSWHGGRWDMFLRNLQNYETIL